MNLSKCKILSKNLTKKLKKQNWPPRAAQAAQTQIWKESNVNGVSLSWFQINCTIKWDISVENAKN